MANPSFEGLKVLVLESRRAKELASLVTTYGGSPIVAPSMREVPLESNVDALAFADALMRGEFDMVILLTGVGTRVLVETIGRARGSSEPFVNALATTKLVCRGPKPVAVLRDLKLPVWLTAPEPNTWRELVAALDEKAGEQPLGGCRIAVQEYGASNPELLAALAARGAHVTRVPVYQWALPEDLEPLKAGIRAVAAGEVDIVLLTTATQVVHLLQVAETMGMADAVRAGLARAVIASIGPTTSEELRHQGIAIDLEPSHPKMGFLVREAAERAREIRRSKFEV